MKENHPCKVSVVIPVYNMEKYIGEAIESILSQTLKETEIVCMDDCGTDSSADIIREYAKRYDNVRLYTMEENGGVGKARAEALKHASGEYIAFMDADDRFSREDALEILVGFADQGVGEGREACHVCAGLVGNFTDEGERDDYHRFRNFFEGKEEKSFADMRFEDIQDDYFFQGFIYRKSLLEEHGITFPDLRAFEDPVFLVRALYYANVIRVVNIEYYDHRYDHKKREISIPAMRAFLKGVILNLEFAEEKGLERLFERTLDRVNKDFGSYVFATLLKEDVEYMGLLLEVGKLAVRNGRSLMIMELLKYIATRPDVFEDFYKYKLN